MLQPSPRVVGVGGDDDDGTSRATASSESLGAGTLETEATTVVDTADDTLPERRLATDDPSPEMVGASGGGGGGGDALGEGGRRGGGDRAKRRVEFSLESDDDIEVGPTGEARGAPPGAMTPSSPPLSRRRKKSGRGNRNRKNKHYKNGSPSLSPARRRGRGGGAARRDWQKEAKRRRNLYKKAIEKAEAEATALETAENSVAFDGNRNGVGWEGETWHGEGEEMGGGDGTQGSFRQEDGRESMVDLEGPRQQQHQQRRQQQRQRWGEAESLEFQQRSDM